MNNKKISGDIVEIIVGNNAGFCFGVNNAVEKAKEYAKQNNKVNCLGELVHNKQVVEELEKEGIEFIENIQEATKPVIIRAHGVEKNIYEKIINQGIKYIDLTCPKVLKIHEIAKKYEKEDYYIFLIGNKNHPETIGTVSFCGENSIVIENDNEIDFAINQYRKSGKDKSLVIAQTTYSMQKFNKIIENLKKEIPNIEIKNTICNATQKRQEETEELSKKVDLMIIIGGKNSSNSIKLYEIANKNCKQCMFVETAKEIDFDLIKNVKKIGIMAGASTPNSSIEEVVDRLNNYCKHK